MSQRYERWMWGAFLAAMILLYSPFHVFAASLSFSPAAETVGAGQTFTITVEAASTDQAMNAASGDISFPGNEVQVVSISKTNSIIDLWVRQPSFTNGPVTGDVHFEGIVLNPGFMGTGGDIIRVTFQAIGPVGSNALITFSSAAILANDGNGTNILTSDGTADYTIVPAPPGSTSPIIHPQPSREPTSTPTTTTAITPSSTVVARPTGPHPSMGAMIALISLLLLIVLIALVAYLIGRWKRPPAIPTAELHEELKRIEEKLQRLEDDIKKEKP